MPLYGFQKQFAPMILNGSKPHTIRRKRKRPTKVGDVLYLYTGLRTKSCQFLLEDTCKKVVPVAIFPEIGQVRLNGRLLQLHELLHFAVQDGFANYMEFFKFFERYPREVRERELEVIYWR